MYEIEQVEGIILAAGYSNRANAFKPGLDLDGQSVFDRCVLGMYDVCSRIIVVGGYNIDRIREMGKRYNKVQVVYNRIFDKGMFTSVKEGLRHISAQRIFITPADYPLIKKETYTKMLAEDGSIIIPVFGGRKGHPVLLDQAAAANIISEPDTSNLRVAIQKNGYKTVDVDDEGILIDLDTPKDYKDIQEKMKRGEDKSEFGY